VFDPSLILQPEIVIFMVVERLVVGVAWSGRSWAAGQMAGWRSERVVKAD
jgi:hypothetical protein